MNIYIFNSNAQPATVWTSSDSQHFYNEGFDLVLTPDQTKIAPQIQQAAATKCIYTRHVREHMQSDDPKRAYSEDNLRQALIKGKVFFWHKESNSPLFGFGSLRVAAALSDGKYPKAVIKTAFIQLS